MNTGTNISTNTNILGEQNGDIESHGSGEYTIIDNKKLRKKVVLEKLYPFYVDEVDSNLGQIKLWATVNSVFSTLTIIMICASTVVSFSAPQFPNVTYISYIAGVFGVVALMCERFAHYCSSQSSASTQRVNMLLESIGIHDAIPDMLVPKPDNDFSSLNKNENNQQI